MSTNIYWINKLHHVKQDSWAASETKEQSLWYYLLMVISSGDTELFLK